MNILYLINYAGKAGTEKYVYNLVNTYTKKGDSCHLAYNIAGKLSDDLEAMGIPSLKLEMRHPFDLKAARILAAYCRQNKIDVIHAQYPRENYIALLSKRYYGDVKVLYTCHLTLKANFIWTLTNKIMTRKNHKIISVCNNGKDILMSNGIDGDKIEVIYNGITPHDATGKNPKLRRELGIDDDTFVIVTLARYSPEKGLPFFVESIKRLKEKTDKKFVLLILGTGDMWDEIASLIKERNLEDSIYQLGFRTDTDEILKVSDLFVNSAKCREALSFAILEAMDASLPVIATRVGGNGDIVSEENDCGILVDYGNTEEMSDAIKLIMDDDSLRKKYSENALKAVRSVFNLDKLSDDTYKLYL